MHAETLQTHLGLTEYVLKRNVEGLTHEDSLRQPQPGGNCANWTLGHIVRTRNNFLGMLAGKPLLDPQKFDRYEINPIEKDSDAVRWEELITAYDQLTGPIMESLGKLTPEKMAEKAPFSPSGNPNETIGSLLAAFTFHEAYHSGQIGLLRRLTGREGAIKSPEAAAKG